MRVWEEMGMGVENGGCGLSVSMEIAEIIG